MKKLKITVFTMMMLPILFTTVSAESWICESGELLREISIKRETANVAPCSVIYDKDIEGKGRKTLWSAQHDGSYCDAKADGLAERLTVSGWSCSAI
jgi:hypothetical protein